MALQLGELRNCLSPRQVEEQLTHLPKDLNELYDRMLSRIEDKFHEDAHKFFQWLVFSERPLKLTELAEVVAVDFKSQELPWFDRELRYYNVEDICRVCSGFVSITEGTFNPITQEIPVDSLNDEVTSSLPISP